MQMWRCWRASEDRKNKLHLESDCLGWKHWAVRLGVQLKNQNCSRSKNLNCYKIIKLVRL